MSEVAEKAAEATAEVVEETIDGTVEVLQVAKNNPVTLVLVGVLGLAAGGAGGYFLAKKRLKSFYEELSANEIAEAKEFYAGVYKTDEDGAVLSPMEVLEQRHPGENAEAIAALREYTGRLPSEAPAATEEELIAEAKASQGHPSDNEMDEAQIRKIEKARLHSISVDKEVGPAGGKVEEVVEEMRNVFVDPNFDLEEEIKHRTSDKPYIITHDEYFAAEKDYDTQSLTYYENDDTLTDEHDKPLREIDKLIGEDHLVRFGHGSKDKSIVYVRNDRLGTDYEIVKSSGSYVEEVLGMLDEPDNSLKHSDQAARRREFRRGE